MAREATLVLWQGREGRFDSPLGLGTCDGQVGWSNPVLVSVTVGKYPAKTGLHRIEFDIIKLAVV